MLECEDEMLNTTETSLDDKKVFAKSNWFLDIISSEDAAFDKVLVLNNISSGKRSFKYLIGYLDDDYKITSLHIMLL